MPCVEKSCERKKKEKSQIEAMMKDQKKRWGHKKREVQKMISLQMTFQFLFLLPHEA